MSTVQLRRRLLTTNSATSAFAIAAGHYTLATLAAALSVTEAVANEMIVRMGAQTETSRKPTCIEVVAFGTGADDSTMSFRVWQLKRGTQGSRRPSIDFELALLATVVCTLSTAVGAAGGVMVTSSERVADTMVVTRGTAASSPKGQAEIIESNYGAVPAAAFSPEGNIPARFYMADVGGGDLVIEPIVGTATGANVLVEVQG